MADEQLIQPKDLSAQEPLVQPTAAPAADAERSSQASSLPEDLLRLPTINALMAGSPPAASGLLSDFAKRPEGKIIAANRESLMQAGFGFYKSLDNSLGVIFNQLYIHPEQIKQADQAGKLQEVAPPFDQIGQAVATSGEAHPVMAHSGQPPEGPAGPPMPQMPVQSSEQPAGVQKKVATARLASVAPGAPTSGAKPGAGRLINSVLKPVV